MKAWEVTFNDYTDTTDYVFASNISKAKNEVVNGRTVVDNKAFDRAKSNGASYADIRIKREPALDGYEKATDMEFGERSITKCGWSCKLGNKYFDKDNFDKEKYEKAFIENYAPDYTVSCVTCDKDIHIEDNLWIVSKPKRYGYFCSFACLVDYLAQDKDTIKLTQDKSNDFVADKVVLHKLLHIY